MARRGADRSAFWVADLLRLQALAGNAAVASRMAIDAGPVPGVAVQRWPTRKELDRRGAQDMRDWLSLPDRGQARYAAIRVPYEGLLDLVDAVNAQLDATTAAAGKAGKEAFTTFLQTAFSSLRKACSDVIDADVRLDLKGTVNLAFEHVRRDEEETRWLVDYKDFDSSLWNNQYSGKSYRRCLQIAKNAGPLFRGGYSADRTFVKKGGLPYHVPLRGDKLHLSADDYSFTLVRDTVLPFLSGTGHTHKIIADVADLSGGQEGKVVTIYPKFDEPEEGPVTANVQGLYALADHLAGWLPTLGILPGPTIASDVPWKGSRYVYLEKNALLRQPKSWERDEQAV